MEVYLEMRPKLNSTVSVVKLNDQILEFFKTNTRQQVRIKVQDDAILQLVTSLDGEKEIDQIAKEQNIDPSELKVLLDFLQGKGILDNVEPKSDFFHYEKYRRVIHFLSEYSVSHEHLLEMWKNINSATVMIIGLGAVGTWVACNLAETGVGRLILMDGDNVDVTNLHRQYGFREEDIGKYKIDALEQRIHEYSKDIQITKIPRYLESNTLDDVGEPGINLIINCADKPNVDTTSLWIGEYCMRHNIPHIIGGGFIYNQSHSKSVDMNYFSPNNPTSCCPLCHGLGEEYIIDEKALMPNPAKPLSSGGITYYKGSKTSMEFKLLNALCLHFGIDIEKKVGDLTETERQQLLYRRDVLEIPLRFKSPNGKYRQKTIKSKGAFCELQEKLLDIDTPSTFLNISKYLKKAPCSRCGGLKLKKDILDIRIAGYNIGELEQMSSDVCLIGQIIE